MSTIAAASKDPRHPGRREWIAAAVFYVVTALVIGFGAYLIFSGRLF